LQKSAKIFATLFPDGGCSVETWCEKKSRFSTNRFVSEMMVSHVPTAVWNDDANRNSK